MRMRILLGLLPLIMGVALGCGGDGTIASGGNYILRVDELRQEVSQLGPSSGYKGTFEDRVDIVQKLATRSYLADEAEERGYGSEDLEQVLAQAEADVVGQAYKEWKIDKMVMVPRIQRRPWIEKLDRRLHLKELIFAVRPIAEEGLEELRQGRDFEDLAGEARGREDMRVNDLGWIVWKDLTRGVANIVFRLDVGEASPIVSGSDGYHVMYLAEAEPMGLGLELLSVRSKRFVTAMELEKLIEQEKAELARKYDVHYRDEGLVAGLKAFAASFRGDRPDDAYMGENVATYSGGAVSVGDLFTIYYSTPQESRPYVGDQDGLREFALQTILPKLEALAGYDMGLHRMTNAVWAVKKAREEHLVPMMEDYFRSQITVTEEEMLAYYEERKQDFVVPARYSARRILVSSRPKVAQVRRQLAAGRDFAEVAGEMSEDKHSASHGGDMGWVNFGMIAPYDSVISGMNPGDTSGPFETSSGTEFLKLEAYEPPRQASYEEAVPRIRMYITNSRSNTLLDEWVTEKKADVGFSINEELLERVTLTPPLYVRQTADGTAEVEEEVQALPRIGR